MLIKSIKFHKRSFRSFSTHLSVEADKDYYGILGISKTASSKEIRASFFSLAKKYHPDLNKEQTNNTKEKFQ